MIRILICLKRFKVEVRRYEIEKLDQKELKFVSTGN